MTVTAAPPWPTCPRCGQPIVTVPHCTCGHPHSAHDLDRRDAPCTVGYILDGIGEPCCPCARYQNADQ